MQPYIKLKVKQIKNNDVQIRLKSNMNSVDVINLLLKVAYEFSEKDKALLLELQKGLEILDK